MKNRRSPGFPSKSASRKGGEPALQPIWSGTVSFSLVAIPVQLVKAVEPGRVSFHMLHSRDYSPLERRMFCPREEKIVPADEIVRGFEMEPDRYILMTDEELESVSPERSRTIEIVEFIDMKDVDPIYYDHPYYLVPQRGGEKSYGLLVEVMGRTNKAGLARFVLGEREYFVAIKSTERALSLITLHYTEEILSDGDAVPEEVDLESDERVYMRETIKGMAAEFNPGKYADERRKRILRLLDKKAKKQVTVKAPEVSEEDGKGPIDLVAMLQESMDKVKKSR
jgi:DNA end-binding protein Ku